MLAFVYSFILLSAEGAHAEGGFVEFYNKYLNYPGFELWKFINLAIFIGVLVYLLKKPVGEAFKARREAIRAELIKAEEEKKAAMERLIAAEAKLASLDAEKAAVLANAKNEADAEKTRILEQAESEVNKLREQANSEITRLTQQTKLDLRRFSASESIRLAEQKLRSKIDAEKDARLIKTGIEAIGGMN